MPLPSTFLWLWASSESGASRSQNVALTLVWPEFSPNSRHIGNLHYMEIRVGPPTITIHADDQFCVCAANAEMSSTQEQGYFAADTRLVSGYRLKLGGARAVLINSA